MKTYIEQCKEGMTELNKKSLEDFVEFWSKSDQTRNRTLPEAIGITLEEYRNNILDYEKIMTIVKSKMQH